MGASELTEIVPRLLELARALAAGADPLKDQLTQLLQVPAQMQERLEAAVTDQLATARKSFDDAVTRAGSLVTEAQQKLADAQQQLAEGTETLEKTLQDALGRADQAQAAAERAREQALGMVDAAQHAVDDARKQADKTFDAAMAEVQQLRKQAQDAATAARKQLDEAVAAGRQAVDKAVADLQAAKDELEAKLVGLKEQIQTEVEQRLAQVQQLPDQVSALADDARARLADALSFPSGILSIVAKGLVWLKGEFFAGDDRLQVVSYTPTPTSHGLGLTWTEGQTHLMLAYCADHPTDKGSFVIKVASATDAPITVGGPDVVFTVSGAGNQTLTIAAGAPPPGLGPAGFSVKVAFNALGFDMDERIVAIGLRAPTFTLAMHHDGAWRYSVAAEVSNYFAKLRPSAALEAAHIPVPISLPEIGESRSFRIAVENGDLIVHEGAAA